MRSDFQWTGVVGRSFGGLVAGVFYGAFCFGPITGFLVCCAVAAFEASSERSALELFTIQSTIFFCSPGAGIGGACGAIWERPSAGARAGLLGGLASVWVFLAWLCYLGDFSWVSWAVLVWGVPPVIAAWLAGASVGALHLEGRPIINPWDRVEDA